MKKYTKDRLLQLLFFVLFWELAFLIMAVFELTYLVTLNKLDYIKNYPTHLESALFLSNAIIGFVGGLTTGLFEVYLLRHRLNHFRFINRLFIKLSIYLPLILILNMLLGFLTAVFDNPIFIVQRSDWIEFISYLQHGIFWLEFFIIAILILLSAAAYQLRFWFNMDHMANFWFGKYRQGREEERVILFMDLDDSTTIAEKLGHTMFFNLLNDCFQDITISTLEYEGKIIDYIGDEVVISWPIEKANLLIEFYHGFNETFRLKKAEYVNKYKLYPVFKAGGHAGSVTIGEIGTETKDIIYAGDVMNSASRIEGLCKVYNRKLLISGDLLEHLRLPSNFTFQSLGELTLNGRRAKSMVYSVSYKDNKKPTEL